VQNQKSRRKNGKLPEEYIRRLTEIGLVWDHDDAVWETRFTELQEYKKQHGHCLVPVAWKTNPTLGRWVFTQRQNYKEGQLSTERIRHLNSIGFCWDLAPVKEAEWNAQFQKLLLYKKQHGGCNVPTALKEDSVLGRWVACQRQYSKTGTLSAEHVRRLNSIGFDWDPFATTLQKRLAELREFKKRFGHTNVPFNWSENPALGEWATEMRKHGRNNFAGDSDYSLTP
jgi:hypothetical protein